MLQTDEFNSIVTEVTQMGLIPELTSSLRANHPGFSFTLCSDDDIAVNAKPVYQAPAFNIYLVGSGDHCLSLTDALELASGVVIAEREDDDDE